MRSEIAAVVGGLGITLADRAVVTASLPCLRSLLRSIIEDFYEHVLATNGAPHLVGVDIVPLKAAQIDHWMRLFADGIDDDYVNRVTRIGLVHRERRILPMLYMQSYGWLASRLVAELARSDETDSTSRAALVGSVLKHVFFDMTMAVRAYDVALVD
jgi:hypothetical protein